MRHRLVVRGGLLACTVLFLLWLAWQALSGVFHQLARSRTIGQKIETVAQLESGILSLLVVLTCFWQRRWAQPIRTIWSISLAATAGLSALVWGPAMPLVGVLFATIALLISRAIFGALQTALQDWPLHDSQLSLWQSFNRRKRRAG